MSPPRQVGGRGQLGRVQHDGGVPGPGMPGHLLGERLVMAGAEPVRLEAILAAGEVDREGVELAAPVPLQGPGRQRGEGAGVQAAGQQGAQRHVRHELAVDDVGEQLPHPADGGGLIVGVRPGAQFPVGPRGQAGPAHPDQAARPDLTQAPVDAVPGRAGPDRGEQLGDAVGVQLGPEAGMGEDRLRLRPEQHAIRGPGEAQRFDPQPVPGQEQLLAGPVPDGEREHAVQPRQAALAPLQPGPQQHLGVRPRRERMPVALKLAA